MLLFELVTTSQRVAETRSRSAKIAGLAELLRRLAPEEIDPAASWLSGSLRQGRIGLGWAAVREAKPEGGALDLLLHSRCSKSPKRPPPFDEVARKACARGDKRGCE